MTSNAFDAFTCLFTRRVSRRSWIGAAAVTAVAMRGTVPVLAQTSDSGYLVQQFYETINAYQYEQAYALLGATWRGEQSLTAFTRGYGNTAFVQCEVASTKPVANSNGTITVHVRLVSWHNDGQIVGYEGTYVVGTRGRIACNSGR